MEKQKGNKGRGNIDEGAFIVKNVKAQITDVSDGTVQFENLSVGCGKATFEDVNNIPIFCMTGIVNEDLVIKENQRIIYLKDDIKNKIIEDIDDATHALIAFESEKFLNNLEINI